MKKNMWGVLYNYIINHSKKWEALVDMLTSFYLLQKHNLQKEKALVYHNFLVGHFKEIRKPSALLGPCRE